MSFCSYIQQICDYHVILDLSYCINWTSELKIAPFRNLSWTKNSLKLFQQKRIYSQPKNRDNPHKSYKSHFEQRLHGLKNMLWPWASFSQQISIGSFKWGTKHWLWSAKISVFTKRLDSIQYRCARARLNWLIFFTATNFELSYFAASFLT